MDTVNEQPKRIFPFPAWIIVGYFALAIAFVATGQIAGFSYDVPASLVEHIAAATLAMICIALFARGTIGKSMLEQMTRAELNKSHLFCFLMSCASAAVIMILMTLRGPASIPEWCLDFLVPWWISWSMSSEYWFVVFHGKPDS